MNILANLWKDGKPFALTMSYDDGTIHDRRLVETFNKYGIRGSFHLNSSRLFSGNAVTFDEVKTLYQGHEVSCHTVNHPFPSALPDSLLIHEIFDDRKTLEDACGYTVRGMSYPYGEYPAHAVDVFRTCGMCYSRTTVATNGFDLPQDFMYWHPTCHHAGDMNGLFDRMVSSVNRRPTLMYVWGHSYEFHNDNNWDKIEGFCAHASGREDVWYATNIEIYDYTKASRSLMFSTDGTKVYNPSCLSVWVTVDGTPAEIKPGENVF